MRLLRPESYQPSLAARFEAVADRLRLAVPFGTVEHIGSSAVPGAESKGDLDVCLLVPPAQLEEAVAMLTASGYREQAGTLRTTELCMLNATEPDCEHSVQVVAHGSAFMSFLIFRDLLRSDPRLVQQYNAVKRQAIHRGEDHYRKQKGEFIEQILRVHGPRA